MSEKTSKERGVVNADIQYLEITVIRDWEGSFPGRQERGKEDNKRCCHFTQYVQVYAKPHHHHQNKTKKYPHDSETSLDMDV